MSSSVSPASRRRSEWPTITHVASPASIGADDLAGVGAGSLVVDVLGADRRRPRPTSRASRTAARQTNGGQMTRVTPGSRVRPAIVAASSPASAGVVCIFQLAATITSRIAANHARAATPGDGARRRESAAVGLIGQGQPSRCARARAGPPSDGAPAARPARRASPRASRAARPRRPARTCGWSASRPSASSDVDRVELAAGRADRALEVGRLGVEDPVELAAQRPRDLARLELQQRPARPDPAQERPDRLGALPGHDAAAATEPPRRRQADVARAARRGPAPPRAATTNSRWVRPPARLSEPRARKRPRSQANRQCSAAARPVERRRWPASSVAVAAEPDGEPGRRGPSRPTASAPRPAASAARSHGGTGRSRRARRGGPRRGRARSGSSVRRVRAPTGRGGAPPLSRS